MQTPAAEGRKARAEDHAGIDVIGVGHDPIGKGTFAFVEHGLDQLAAEAVELIKPMLDECERALADGIVANADHVDAGVIFGTGFAPFRGGPMHYRRSQEAGATAQAA